MAYFPGSLAPNEQQKKPSGPMRVMYRQSGRNQDGNMGALHCESSQFQSVCG
jgi:hypothetical protein